MEITSIGQLLLGVASIISTVGVVGQVVATTTEQPVIEEVSEAEVPLEPTVAETPVKVSTPEPQAEPTPQPEAEATPEPVTSTSTSTPKPTAQQEPIVIGTPQTTYTGLTEAEIGRPVVLPPGSIIQDEDKGRIMSAWSYVLTWAGVCPSQQVHSEFTDMWGKNAALGAWSEYPTLEYYIDQSWGLYNGGTLTSGYFLVPVVALGLSNSSTANRAIDLKVDHRTRTVTLSTVFESDSHYLTEPQADWLDLQSRAQAYLDSLYARYAAKCPND